LVTSWLDDPVFAVRETAIESIKRIVRQFGSEWAVKGLLPRLLELGRHRNYLRRNTLLFALSATCSVVSPIVVESMYLPVLQQLSTDPIANVRLNVAKALEAVVPVLAAESAAKELLRAPIIPILQQLQRDADVDVHDFATQALNIIPAF
jgi:serine/threonine-protein phosphatase 2A regulatory subunit A